MNDGIILWEAHRGGGGGFEIPESCHLSFEYGWLIGGRPEADVNMTADGVIVSIHDSTLDRIGRNLPEEIKGKQISELTFAQIRACDVGWDEYPNQRVPAMHELFEVLRNNKNRNMIIDYKRVPLDALAALIREYGVGEQITFASCDRALCREIKGMVPEIRTKNWLGGTEENIVNQFRTLEKEKFENITEVQLHLRDKSETCPYPWKFHLSPEFVKEALAITKKNGVLLQTLPWSFEREDMMGLLDMGIRSFAVDYPNKFTRICAEYFSASRAK